MNCGVVPFTTATSEEHKQLIKRCNRHLNEPVREGEIVIFPTMEPKTEQEKSWFNELLEEAKIASLELGKLLDEEVATLHRHFDLFSHQLWERIKSDGLPADYYAQVSTGVGATSALVEQNLKNINGVLIEINDLYASQIAMASRTGGINYGPFVAERAELFKKLDGSGDCGKTTTREVAGFIGGAVGGIKAGSVGVGLAVTAVSGIALFIGVTASAPVLAVAAISGAIAGGFVGGGIGGTAGKAGGDLAYEIYE